MLLIPSGPVPVLESVTVAIALAILRGVFE
jgi:hypothetical protein